VNANAQAEPATNARPYNAAVPKGVLDGLKIVAISSNVAGYGGDLPAMRPARRLSDQRTGQEHEHGNNVT